MFGRIKDRNILLIFVAIFFLGLAYGIAISLLPLYLNRLGYSKTDLGTLASIFALGVVVLSIPWGKIIEAISARASLIICLFGYAVAVAAFPLVTTFASISIVRFVDGAFSVGVWVACETILLSRAEKAIKAFVTSIYAMCLACGYILGPLIAKGLLAEGMKMGSAFFVSGAIATAVGVLVLARLDGDVKAPKEAEEKAGGAASAPIEVFLKVKTSCLATFSYGYFQAAVVIFLPLYLMDTKHVPEEQTLYVPAAFAAGMLIFSNIGGRLGDRYGHLKLMRGMGVVGTSMILAFVYLDSLAVMLVAVFIAGATLAAISPVSLALIGVVTKHEDLARANSFYNVFYALGMLIGPQISGQIFKRAGGVPMLYHFVGLWSAFVLFTIVFWRDDPAARRGEAPNMDSRKQPAAGDEAS